MTIISVEFSRLHCRILPRNGIGSLSRTPLPLGKHSGRSLVKKFSAARIPPVYANHLADIKQGKDESLKSYIQRFMREANRATTVGDEGKMVAISVGITYRSPLWDSIHRNPISALQ